MKSDLLDALAVYNHYASIGVSAFTILSTALTGPMIRSTDGFLPKAFWAVRHQWALANSAAREQSDPYAARDLSAGPGQSSSLSDIGPESEVGELALELAIENENGYERMAPISRQIAPPWAVNQQQSFTFAEPNSSSVFFVFDSGRTGVYLLLSGLILFVIARFR